MKPTREAAAAVCIVGRGCLRRSGETAATEGNGQTLAEGAAGPTCGTCRPGGERAAGARGGVRTGATPLRPRQSRVRTDAGRGRPAVGDRPTAYTTALNGSANVPSCRTTATRRHTAAHLLCTRSNLGLSRSSPDCGTMPSPVGIIGWCRNAQHTLQFAIGLRIMVPSHRSRSAHPSG